LKPFNLLLLAKGTKDAIVSSSRNSGILQLVDYSPNGYDDKVVLYGDEFKELFKSSRYKATNSLKRLAIVKITNNMNGETIHRAFYGRKNIQGLVGQVGLSYNSIRHLSDENNAPDGIKQVSISKGSVFLYFWNHPFHATRISMRLGVISLIITIFLSIFLFVLGLLINCH